MTDHATIRKARTGDISDMAALLQELFSIEADFEPDTATQEMGLAMLLTRPGAVALVAQAQGRAVGMCTGQLVVSTAEGGPALLAEDLVVAPEFRGRGLGAKLMDNLALWAASKGATRMQLLADRNNKDGFGFYEATGWSGTDLVCLRKHLDKGLLS